MSAETPVRNSPEIAPSAQPDRTKGRALLLLGQLAVLLVWGGAWEWAARVELAPPNFIGQPSVFLRDFVNGLVSGTYLSATVVTMQATIAAFLIGTVMALLTALLMTAVPLVERLLAPIIDALNALPRVALIPLFIIWFGLGLAQKIVSGVSIMYFILLSYTLAGAKSVEPDHLLLARSLGIPRWRVFMTIVIPTAIPSIFAGMRLGMIYTVLGVITAELLAGGKGLGTLVSFYSNTFETNQVFAVLIVLILLTSALSAGMTAVERFLGRWRSN